MSKVKQGQSFLDKVIHLTGNVENALAMALLNEVSITDYVAIGDEFKVSSVTDKSVVDFFNQDNEPATAFTAAQSQEINPEGISFWIINNDFVVS